jgi:hypothetical protein
LTGESRSDPRDEALRLSYTQICSSYQGIAEFRGKLLALLPLATGTGAFFLLQRHDETGFLAPIGLLGVVVTVGLFMYELRGIQRCHILEKQAETLEKALHLRKHEAQFWSQPRRLGDMLGPPGAGLIVYIAVVFVWIYVAGVGGGWWADDDPHSAQDGFAPAWILLPLYGVIELAAWFLTRAWLQRQLARWGETSSA